jgi:uncharacterized glyoxalase superfamily protein PhnB
VISVSPHLVVPDASEASTWYARAFGAQEISRVPLPGDRAMSVQVQIGESTIHLGSEFRAAGILSPASIGGTATVLQITTEDAQALWHRALDAGAEQHHPLAEQFWGELHGQLTDPFGHRWNIAEKIRDVSPEEIAAAAAEIFGQPATDSRSNDG